MLHSPPSLRGAAVVQAVESALVLAATVLAGVDAATGQSYHVSSGIALTAIGAAAAVALGLVALGLVRARRWSRTPALLTQLFVGIVGIYLLQGHRLDWGIVSVVLAALGFAGLFAPPSMRALTGSERAVTADRQAPAAGQAGPGRKPASARKPPAPARKPPASGGKPPADRRKPPAPAPGRKRAR